MSKIVAMNYRWMKKEILRTEAMPFTITQISCLLLLVQKLRVGLFPPVVWKIITKTQLVPQLFERENVICGVQCWTAPTRDRLLCWSDAVRKAQEASSQTEPSRTFYDVTNCALLTRVQLTDETRVTQRGVTKR